MNANEVVEPHTLYALSVKSFDGGVQPAVPVKRLLGPITEFTHIADRGDAWGPYVHVMVCEHDLPCSASYAPGQIRKVSVAYLDLWPGETPMSIRTKLAREQRRLADHTEHVAAEATSSGHSPLSLLLD